MPYVDERESPRKAGLPIWAPYAAGGMGAVLAFFLWGPIYLNMDLNMWLAPVLTGPIIGGAIRLTARRPLPYTGPAAILLTVVTSIAAYLYRHVAIVKWQDPAFKPDLAHAVNWFLGDLQAFLLIGVAAYIALVVARAYPASTPQRHGR